MEYLSDPEYLSKGRDQFGEKISRKPLLKLAKELCMRLFDITNNIEEDDIKSETEKGPDYNNEKETLWYRLENFLEKSHHKEEQNSDYEFVNKEFTLYEERNSHPEYLEKLYQALLT